MNNFSELKSNVGALVGRSGDAAYLVKIGVWLNLAHDFLAQSYDFFTELQDVYNFTTVDGRENYILPNRFDKPLSKIFDLTNHKELSWETENIYIQENQVAVADSEEGVPSKARIYGTQGITGTLAAAGTIVKVKSSSASDTSGIIVRVEGYIDSNSVLLDYENITIAAAGPTTYVSGTKTFYKITHVSKSSDTTGYVTLADSADVVIGYILSTERVLRHKVLKLGKIPDSAYSMRLPYKKRAFTMVNANDYPFTDCDNYLILDAWGWALSQEKETIDRSVTVWAKSKEAYMAILLNNQNKLGPEYQQKIDNIWAQSHRSR